MGTEKMPARKVWLGLVVIGIALLGGGYALGQNTPSFTDVPDGHYAEDAIAWAVANGITVGCSDTQFCPDALLTRAQAVTFLYRAVGPKTTNPPTATTTTTAPEACADVICPTDHYPYERFSNTYWVFEFVTTRSCTSLYVEVQLLDENERRIGDWGNEFISNARSGEKLVVEILSNNQWTFYEWEYNCR